jgi:ribosomal protein S18 acetylase RimI-like enzyme
VACFGRHRKTRVVLGLTLSVPLGAAIICFAQTSPPSTKLTDKHKTKLQQPSAAPKDDKSPESDTKSSGNAQQNTSAVTNGDKSKSIYSTLPVADQIALWTMIGSVATALATAAQVGVTYLIARSIAKASSSSEALSISREIDRIWQDFNRHAITNEDFRNTIRRMESLSETSEMTQLRHLIFYLLNIIYISWTAQREKRDSYEHSQTIVKDHLTVLYSQKDLVLSILNGHRGYNKTFVQDCVNAFAQIDNERPQSDIVNKVPAKDLESERTSNSNNVAHSQPDVELLQPNLEDHPMIEPVQSSGEAPDLNPQGASVVQQHSDGTETEAVPRTDGKQSVLTRFAKPEEWQVIQALNLQIFEFELENCEPTSNLEYPFSKEGVEYFQKAVQQKDNYSAIVAEVDEVVVGYAIVKKIPDVDLTHRVGVVQYQLHTLSVDKNHRDKGIGGELVKAAMAFAKQRGANRIKVVAYAGNDRAEHLYKKNGFAELETTYEAKL